MQTIPKLPSGTTGFYNDKNEWVCTGSAMGRHSWRDHANDPVKVYLRREYLDSGGYDSAGAYWGTGEPLYRANFDIGDTNEDLFLRAWSRDEAKDQVRKQLPNARFFN